MLRCKELPDAKTFWQLCLNQQSGETREWWRLFPVSPASHLMRCIESGSVNVRCHPRAQTMIYLPSGVSARRAHPSLTCIPRTQPSHPTPGSINPPLRHTSAPPFFYLFLCFCSLYSSPEWLTNTQSSPPQARSARAALMTAINYQEQHSTRLKLPHLCCLAAFCTGLQRSHDYKDNRADDSSSCDLNHQWKNHPTGEFALIFLMYQATFIAKVPLPRWRFRNLICAPTSSGQRLTQSRWSRR